MSWGKFYGIGVGPGDPELLTIKAQRMLKELDLLFIPKSKQEKRSLALSIVLGAVKKDWELVELILPMTRDQEELNSHWRKAAEKVVSFLAQGKSGAFITLGDPTLFSTFTYLLNEVQILAPEAEVEIIPGISAINYISSRLQVPLAEGEESLLITPAPENGADLELFLERFPNVVLMKAGRRMEQIARTIAGSKGRFEASLASRCGFPDECLSSDIDSLRNCELDYLSTVLIKRRPGGDR